MSDTLEDRLEASFKRADRNKTVCPDCEEPVSACDHFYCKECGNYFDADEVIYG